MEYGAPAVSLVPMRVLPDTCIELFMNFHCPQRITVAGSVTPSYGRSFLTARMNRFMDVQTHGGVGFVSVCFAAGLAYPFFPMPMQDVANRVIDLRDVWGHSADELQERIDNASTVAQRVQLIQHDLIGRLRRSVQPDRTVDFCINQLKARGGCLSLEELASGVGISNRHLVRRFRHCIGLAPKEFARMMVFLSALDQLKNYPTSSLTEIAHESGYYDQAHFIHACREYSGMTPSQLIVTDQVLY